MCCMAGMSRRRTYLRFVSLVAVLGFFPSSICVWNFDTQAFMVAHADVEEPCLCDQGRKFPARVSASALEAVECSEREERDFHQSVLRRAPIGHVQVPAGAKHSVGLGQGGALLGIGEVVKDQ